MLALFLLTIFMAVATFCSMLFAMWVGDKISKRKCYRVESLKGRDK